MKRKRPLPSEKVKFDQEKEVRAIARERVGAVKPSRVIVPKQLKKPKHKKPPGTENGSE